MRRPNESASGRRSGRLGVLSFVSMCVLASAQLAADCVDGVTADCSNPAACAPSEGDAAPAVDAQPESSVAPPPPPAGRDAEAGDAAEGG